MKRQTHQLSRLLYPAGAGPLLLLALLTLAIAGCVSHDASTPQAASAKLAPIYASEPWTSGDTVGKSYRLPHYTLHTTIKDEDFLQRLAEVMEAAVGQYQQFTPGVKLSRTPMDCYVFQWRKEWAAFTTDRTGSDAALYLQINRGGYTVDDWFVAYYISDDGTFKVAAHEGWHQYVARHFKSRLPPFLEEGIATMFENVTFYNNSSPKFDLSPRTSRAMKLRSAIENGQLWPLEKLVTMHAGDVVSLGGPRIEAFYAQNWAFAQFLWDAEDGRYRGAFQRLLTDCANGTVYEGPGAKRRGDGWRPHTVKPMLEHYLGMSLDEVDARYQAYCRKIASAQRFNPRP